MNAHPWKEAKVATNTQDKARARDCVPFTFFKNLCGGNGVEPCSFLTLFKGAMNSVNFVGNTNALGGWTFGGGRDGTAEGEMGRSVETLFRKAALVTRKSYRP